MIRMRVNNSNTAVCSSCGVRKPDIITIYDLCIGDKQNGCIVHLCAMCNDILFQKTLRANCIEHKRLKTRKELQHAIKERQFEEDSCK